MMPIFMPSTLPVRAAATRSSSGSGSEVESRGSCPPMTWCSRAESSTVRETGPIWSSEEAMAMAP